MKIGILTYHRSHNYGAFLQAYSLSNKLNSIDGIECELINYNLATEDNVYKKLTAKKMLYYFQYKKQDKMFNDSQKHQKLSSKLILSDDYNSLLNEIEDKYDIVLVGSDEIWRIGSRGFPNAYWLPGKHKFIKMSYAASGRNSNKKLTDEVKKQMSEFYKDFEYIGARDSITKEQIENLSKDIKVNRNCDPAFLYNKYNKNKVELREQICNKYRLNPNKKIITIIYDRIDIISKMKKLLGTKDYQYICITRPMINATKNLCAINPFEWADVIGGSDFVISAYFHGMLFAINQNTPFVVIDRRANSSNLETSKLYDLLSYEKMVDRYYIASEITEDKYTDIAKRIKDETSGNNKVDFSKVIENELKLYNGFEKEVLRIKDEREK